jgi:putative tryptophan/tyrosine transport system substrate-binding protein
MIVSRSRRSPGPWAKAMRRRDFITAIAGSAAAWPLATRAQQPAMPVVGFMNTLNSTDQLASELLAAFHQGLKQTGFVEGQNVAVEYRWTEGRYERLPGFATDLVRRKVDVIAATGGEPSPQAAKAATQTIPIVFTANGDPVREGLVASVNRPGGNVTGFTIFGPAAVTKRVELMHELAPQAGVIAYLMNPDHPSGEIEMQAAEAAARSLGKKMLVFRASNEPDLDETFAIMVQQQVGALVVASDAFFWSRRGKVVSLAARYGLPAIYYLTEFSRVGGLMAYGNSVPDMYHLVGVYVGRILKGEKPADLPVEQPTKFDMVINIKTAKSLGIAVPDKMIALADEVIE